MFQRVYDSITRNVLSMFQLVDFTETRREFFSLLVDFRRNEGKGRWSNTWNAQLTFTGQIQIPHCIISPEAISVPLSPSQNERGKKSKQLPLFFRIIWLKLRMETALHDAAASLQPRSQISETTGRACVCEHESSSASPPFALTEDKCQRAERERERSERRERTRLQNRARIPYETQTQKRNANWPHQSEQTMPWMPPMAQQRVVSQITVRHVAHRCASNAEQCTIRNTRLPSLPSAAYRLVAVPLLEGDACFSPIPPR